MFGENEVAVVMDVEDAAFSCDELDVFETLGLQLVRQTGGARMVVSHFAVRDFNHGRDP